MPPISKEQLDADYQKFKEIEPSAKKLVTRLSYIVNFIFKTFNIKHRYYWFYDYENVPEIEIFNKVYSKLNTIGYYTGTRHLRSSHYGELYIIDSVGKEYDLFQEFPKRWIFEDFEQELLEGKKRYEDKLAADELRLKNSLSTKKKLIASAKKKLTKAEKKALNLK